MIYSDHISLPFSNNFSLNYRYLSTEKERKLLHQFELNIHLPVNYSKSYSEEPSFVNYSLLQIEVASEYPYTSILFSPGLQVFRSIRSNIHRLEICLGGEYYRNITTQRYDVLHIPPNAYGFYFSTTFHALKIFLSKRSNVPDQIYTAKSFSSNENRILSIPAYRIEERAGIHYRMFASKTVSISPYISYTQYRGFNSYKRDYEYNMQEGNCIELGVLINYSQLLINIEYTNNSYYPEMEKIKNRGVGILVSKRFKGVQTTVGFFSMLNHYFPKPWQYRNEVSSDWNGSLNIEFNYFF
jgi:hypothetical protein